MNIGLFFGSFNPIHTGHLILAQTALNDTDLDRIWFVVSPQNPLKQKKNLISEFDRLTMVELAVEWNKDFHASNVEFALPRPSYTIDTLTMLADKYRSYHFSLIMGEDNLQYLHKWKNHEAILNYYTIYLYPRVDTPPSPLDAHPSIQRFEAPLLNISATYIRETLQAGKSIRYLVPQAVEEYILWKGLYVWA